MGRKWKQQNKQRHGKGKGAGGKKRYFGKASPHANNQKWQTNRRMEAYYAYQGLHGVYLDEESGNFKQCETDEEKSAEYTKWMETLKKILPHSFRIGTDVDPIIRERLQAELHEMVGKEMEIVIDPRGGRREVTKEIEGELKMEKISPAKQIPFIPFAYQLAVDRRTVSRNPALAKLHEWLKIQTEAGFVTRQETVSMIPPAVMDVQRHHVVLDMCAAPGSKTSQILEIVSQPLKEGDLEPTGCVVANDTDPKRAYMLVHQLKRINSPSALVTSCDAQFFPLLTPHDEKMEGKEGMFDRVLADVPCSGDGTMRKNPGVWGRWWSLNSYSLHPIQIAIALNGARLTKVGGLLCYSTCAMNPIENEAVVCELLRATDGALELVDRRADLNNIKARRGWTTWKVLRENKSQRQVSNEKKKNNKKMQERRKQFNENNKRVWEDGKEGDEGAKDGDAADGDAGTETKEVGAEGAKVAGEAKIEGDEQESREEVEDEEAKKKADELRKTPLGAPASWDEETLRARCLAEGYIEYTSFEQVEEDNKSKKTCRQSCFPPTEEEVKQFHLDKCMRFLQHDMDTSGFFVACFRKVKPLSQKARQRATELAQELRPDCADDEGREQPAKKAKLDPTAEASDDAAKTEGAATMDVDPAAATNEDDATKPAESAEAEPAELKVVKGKNSKRGNAPKGNMGNEDFINVDPTKLEPLIPFYGLSEGFPKEQYMIRSNSDSKILHFISKAVKRLFDVGLQKRITIIHSGLKGFERNSAECGVRYRIAQEGVHYLVPFVSSRKFVIDVKDYIKCLRKGAIRLAWFSTDLAEKIRELCVGAFVVVLQGYEGDIGKKLVMTMWRCRGDNVNCLVSQVERDGMVSKLRAITGEEIVVEAQEDAKPAAAGAPKAGKGEAVKTDEKTTEEKTGVDTTGEVNEEESKDETMVVETS